VAGNPVSVQPTTCPACGTKLSALLKRCPRCRAVLAAPDPVAVAAASRKLRRVAAGIAGAFVLFLSGLWLARELTPVPEPPPPVQPAATSRPAAPPVTPQAPIRPTEVERAFLDPPGAAAVAYGAGDMEAALQHYQAAIQRNPNDAESLSNLGQVLVRLNRTPEALPYFDRAITLIPDRWAYTFNRARALGLLGRWKECVTDYRRAQALFPGDYVTTFNLALAMRRLGDNEAAVAEFQKAIALEPNEATFRMALGMTYERLQKADDAAAAYEEALRLAPQAPDADIVRGRIAQLRRGSGGA
jgi:Flp pilus assembly protein TadD